MRTPAIILLSTLLSATAFAKDKDAAGLFDKPLKVAKVPLPADPLNPQAKPVVSCSYFKDFAVKEINRGEVGAELSIVPLSAGGEAYKCGEAAAPGEIATKDWSGYFKGAKGAYVFYSADDGHNGGMGFAIYNGADGKKLFDDTAMKLHAVRFEAGRAGAALHEGLRGGLLAVRRSGRLLGEGQGRDGGDASHRARLRRTVQGRGEADEGYAQSGEGCRPPKRRGLRGGDNARSWASQDLGRPRESCLPAGGVSG